MTKNRLLWVLLSLLPTMLVGGCMADVADKGWQPMRPLGSDLAVYRPPVEAKDAATPPAAIEEPEGALTLRQALAAALLHNPELASVSWEVRKAEARALQAGLPPNPEIAFDLESLARPRVIETVLGMGQVIFLSDKLARQKQAAALERDLAGWDYEAKRLSVFAETTQAFVALVAAQEKAALAEELVGVSEKVLAVAAERVKSGKTPPVEEMRARVELGTVRILRERALHETTAARRSLAAQWGSTSPRFARAEGRLAPPESIPTWDQLGALVAQNPDVARWAVEMQRRHALTKLERARAIPDLTIGGGWKRETEKGGEGGTTRADGFTLGASIPLPLWDRNQGGIKESQYGIAQAHHDSRAAQARVVRDLAEAYQSLAAAHAESQILSRDMLPEARKAFDATTEGYRYGKFPFLDVLDAQRTLFEVRSEHLEALAAFYTAAAHVEGLVGQSLESVRDPQEKRQEQ